MDSEITAVANTIQFDPDADSENQKMSHVITVGWDKKIHIWPDEKEEEVETCKILPKNEQKGH